MMAIRGRNKAGQRKAVHAKLSCRDLVKVDSRKPSYVNAYKVGREYGGPEGGGWWYNVGVPLASIPVKTEKEAEQTRKGLEAAYACVNQKGEYGVHGVPKEKLLDERNDDYSDAGIYHTGEKLKVVVERHKARKFPKRTPYYE